MQDKYKIHAHVFRLVFLQVYNINTVDNYELASHPCRTNLKGMFICVPLKPSIINLVI